MGIGEDVLREATLVVWLKASECHGLVIQKVRYLSSLVLTATEATVAEQACTTISPCVVGGEWEWLENHCAPQQSCGRWL
jgi:hypothetical protein